jgi:hypothetical protein
MRMSSGLNISTDKTKNKTKFLSVLKFISWSRKKYPHEISDDHYFRYLQSQINYLSLKFSTRLSFFLRIRRITRFLQSIALLINRSRVYKLLNKID